MYEILSFVTPAPVLFFFQVTLTMTSVSTDEAKSIEQVKETFVPATSEPPERMTDIGTAGGGTTKRNVCTYLKIRPGDQKNVRSTYL